MDLPPSQGQIWLAPDLPIQKGGDLMSNNHRCCSYRIKLEKIKQNTWTLCVLFKVLDFLVNLVDCYLR